MPLGARVAIGVPVSTLRSEFAESPRTWPDNLGFILFMGDLRRSLPRPLVFSMEGDAGPGVRFQIEFEFH